MPPLEFPKHWTVYNEKQSKVQLQTSTWLFTEGLIVVNYMQYSVLIFLKVLLSSYWYEIIYCFRRSFSTAPALASGDTGSGVKVGNASEMGFMSRCPELLAGVMRGTAADRGAKNGFVSGLLLALETAESEMLKNKQTKPKNQNPTTKHFVRKHS